MNTIQGEGFRNIPGVLDQFHDEIRWLPPPITTTVGGVTSPPASPHSLSKSSPHSHHKRQRDQQRDQSWQSYSHPTASNPTISGNLSLHEVAQGTHKVVTRT
eukprot:6219305-Amphidinium_carterae.1